MANEGTLEEAHQVIEVSKYKVRVCTTNGVLNTILTTHGQASKECHKPINEASAGQASKYTPRCTSMSYLGQKLSSCQYLNPTK